MLNLTKPQYVLPFHGDHKRLAPARRTSPSRSASTATGSSSGRNGLALEIDEKGARFGEDVHASMIFVDGVSVGEPDEFALRDRRKLSDDGVFIVVATISADDGSQVADPEVIFRGVPFAEDADGLGERAPRGRRRHPRRGRRGAGPRGLPAPAGPPRRHRASSSTRSSAAGRWCCRSSSRSRTRARKSPRRSREGRPPGATLPPLKPASAVLAEMSGVSHPARCLVRCGIYDAVLERLLKPWRAAAARRSGRRHRRCGPPTTEPPWDSATARTIARPRPLPPPPAVSAGPSPRTKRSKTWSSICAGMPGPSSTDLEQRLVRVAPRGRARRVAFSGVWRTAFSSRLRTAGAARRRCPRAAAGRRARSRGAAAPASGSTSSSAPAAISARSSSRGRDAAAGVGAGKQQQVGDQPATCAWWRRGRSRRPAGRRRSRCRRPGAARGWPARWSAGSAARARRRRRTRAGAPGTARARSAPRRGPGACRPSSGRARRPRRRWPGRGCASRGRGCW